jgi:hypothetical protein
VIEEEMSTMAVTVIEGADAPYREAHLTMIMMIGKAIQFASAPKVSSQVLHLSINEGVAHTHPDSYTVE